MSIYQLEPGDVVLTKNITKHCHDRDGKPVMKLGFSTGKKKKGEPEKFFVCLILSTGMEPKEVTKEFVMDELKYMAEHGFK